MKIAYLGPQGSFSEEAALRYFTPNTKEWHRCDTILDVLEAVGEHKADKGIVPIENSIEGTINITADGLLANDLFIEAEVIFPVTMHLLTLEETDLQDIREVWSVPPALAQCREYIRKSEVKSVRYDSTSSAARAIKQEGRRDVAAIASKSAADLFQLHIAKSGIQDNGENHTRFFVISRENTQQHKSKTMLVITPCEDYPGMLASILNVFTALTINLTWIESRPTKKKLGNYHFFIEAEAGLDEAEIKKAITIFEAFGHDVRVLGTYDRTKLYDKKV
ncbi:prephenate dehydratase [Oceanobacillus halotolerans]|uniref:prephenate dehydratase n=1 Tax=Oceanobacillus halotolerans TaxID=2663380 RepID=UPI0013DB6E92|nr:prephenate dehydratase [Oceanobacillus halotolerans]